MISMCSRHVFLFALLGLPSGMVLAAAEQANGSLSLGYRVDSLDWNIRAVNSGPNILSELEWKGMDISQLRGELSGSNDENIYFRGQASYGWVWDGRNQDSDYAGDNRSLEFSRSSNSVDGSKVLDLSAGLGVIFSAGAADQWQIVPMAGYSWHYQGLRMRDGNQVVWDSSNAALLDIGGNVPLGPFAGLNSTYDAKWYGPWLGADIFLDLQAGGTVFVRLEAHRVRYSAQANWNLRGDFAHPVSFEHRADGWGRVLELGWQDTFSPHYWMWGVNVTMQSWRTDSGIDRIFFSDGSVGVLKLNEVRWSSRSINLTLRKAFAN
ncbi:MAG: hypothetical protein L3J84_09445 [Gammaproteobacteria bacterium]|nr:hypothetical protein [Gammaproteobacteria bacterium]